MNLPLVQTERPLTQGAGIGRSFRAQTLDRRRITFNCLEDGDESCQLSFEVRGQYRYYPRLPLAFESRLYELREAKKEEKARALEALMEDLQGFEHREVNQKKVLATIKKAAPLFKEHGASAPDTFASWPPEHKLLFLCRAATDSRIKDLLALTETLPRELHTLGKAALVLSTLSEEMRDAVLPLHEGEQGRFLRFISRDVFPPSVTTGEGLVERSKKYTKMYIELLSKLEFYDPIEAALCLFNLSHYSQDVGREQLRKLNARHQERHEGKHFSEELLKLLVQCDGSRMGYNARHVKAATSGEYHPAIEAVTLLFEEDILGPLPAEIFTKLLALSLDGYAKLSGELVFDLGRVTGDKTPCVKVIMSLYPELLRDHLDSFLRHVDEKNFLVAYAISNGRLDKLPQALGSIGPFNEEVLCACVEHLNEEEFALFEDHIEVSAAIDEHEEIAIQLVQAYGQRSNARVPPNGRVFCYLRDLPGAFARKTLSNRNVAAKISRDGGDLDLLSVVKKEERSKVVINYVEECRQAPWARNESCLEVAKRLCNLDLSVAEYFIRIGAAEALFRHTDAFDISWARDGKTVAASLGRFVAVSQKGVKPLLDLLPVLPDEVLKELDGGGHIQAYTRAVGIHDFSLYGAYKEARERGDQERQREIEAQAVAHKKALIAPVGASEWKDPGAAENRGAALYLFGTREDTQETMGFSNASKLEDRRGLLFDGYRPESSYDLATPSAKRMELIGRREDVTRFFEEQENLLRPFFGRGRGFEAFTEHHTLLSSRVRTIPAVDARIDAHIAAATLLCQSEGFKKKLLRRALLHYAISVLGEGHILRFRVRGNEDNIGEEYLRLQKLKELYYSRIPESAHLISNAFLRSNELRVVASRLLGIDEAQVQGAVYERLCTLCAEELQQIGVFEDCFSTVQSDEEKGVKLFGVINPGVAAHLAMKKAGVCIAHSLQLLNNPSFIPLLIHRSENLKNEGLLMMFDIQASERTLLVCFNPTLALLFEVDEVQFFENCLGVAKAFALKVGGFRSLSIGSEFYNQSNRVGSSYFLALQRRVRECERSIELERPHLFGLSDRKAYRTRRALVIAEL